MLTQRTIYVFISTTVISLFSTVTSYQLGSSSCTLLIPSLLLESGINSPDIVRCGNEYLPYVPVTLSSQCQSHSTNFMYCTSPVVIYRNSSNLLSAKEGTNVTSSDDSMEPKESLIECTFFKNGFCNRMFHHLIDKTIEEIPSRLDIRYAYPEGLDDISSISQAHCSSYYIGNFYCAWQKETPVLQPSDALMKLMQKHVMYDGEKNITSLLVVNISYRYEYQIDLGPPITTHLSFSSSLESLISYNVFSNLPQLESVHLQDLTLRELPPNVFIKNTELKSCVITNTMLETVDPGLFQSAVELTKVVLSNNMLETLPEGLFQNNIHLRTLNLAENRIQYLPEGFLSQTNNLSSLVLTNNHLQDLQLTLLKNPPETTYFNFTNARPVPSTFARRYRFWLNDETKKVDIFKTVKTNSFIKIDISYNRLQRIPDEIFDGSIILTIFRAHHNKEITKLTGSHIFYALQEFSMSDCSINSITEDFFAKSIENNPLYVKKIDLSRNKLDILHPRTFWNCQELEILKLSENKISRLDDRLFKDLINLKILDVSGNVLLEFQPETFNLRSIVHLDFSRNRIHRFHPAQMLSLFQSSTNSIKRFDLYRNCLTTETVRLPSVNISRPLFLKQIQLLYAPLETNSSKREENNPSLGNPIFGKSYKSVEGINLRPLILDMRIGPIEEDKPLCPNPFKQFCEYFPHTCPDVTNITWGVIEERFNRIHLINCIERIAEYNSVEDVIQCPFSPKCPANYYESILTSAMGYYDKDVSFTCPVTISCPSPCRCYKRSIEDEIVVDCNNKGLSQLPRVPPNTKILYFNHNKLQNLHDLKSSVWSNLTELYVENNKITSINGIFFPYKLKLVSLKNNELESIDKDNLDVLNEIEFSLSGNPWRCDCNILYLKAKLNTVNKVSDAKSMFCASLNISILDSPNELLCPERVSVSSNISLALPLGIILPLFVGVFVLLYYRNKELVKAYLFTNFPIIFRFTRSSGQSTDKRFDAFVAYGSSERDIIMQMIEELENKEPYFKLCIHERDWLPGNPIATNIAESVSCSRKSIIILSMEFVQSMWFPVELHTVYHQMLKDKVNRTIIVMKGEIPPVNELDDFLQILLKTKTYLVWSERWFWEKLRYALIKKDYHGDSLKDNGPTNDFIEKVKEEIVNAEAIQTRVVPDFPVNESTL